jgi:hypothetical protein
MKTLIRLFAIFLALFSTNIFAQDNSYEALIKLYSSPTSTGTARFQAIGGNHSALGADVSAASGNPAGLGFYTRSEFSFTPGYQSTSNSSVYAVEPSRTTNANVNNFNIANIGVIFAGQEPRFKDGWRGTFGISYSRQNTLYNNIQFRASGGTSSITDSYAESVNRQIQNGGVTQSGLLGELNNYGPNDFSGTAPLYYWGYLIDAVNNTNSPFIGAEANSKVNQSLDFQSTGRVSQWTLAYGGTANENFYIGGSIGLPSYRYETVKTFTEAFQNYQEIRGFSDTRILTASGSGFNLTLGAIYKPSDVVRLGLTVVTPTWYDVDESSSSSVSVDVDAAKGVNIGNAPDNAILNRLNNIGYKITQRADKNYYITSIPRLSTTTYDDNYQIRTPFKLSGGAAVFFKKKGFLSADVEYVAYRGMNLSTSVLDSPIQNDLDNGNDNIKLFYNNVLNLKVGGEYRIGMVSLRGGVSYYQNPYSSNFDRTNTINRSQMIYSAGVGYRTNAFYVDVTGLYGSTQQSYTPYRLANSTDFASAKVDNSFVKGVVSFGVFF